MIRKKFLWITCSLVLNFWVNAQVGMPTSAPRGALDINNDQGVSQYGLVLPTNTSTSAFFNPIQTFPVQPIAFGTLIFDSSESCIKFYRSKNGGEWSTCLMLTPKI